MKIIKWTVFITCLGIVIGGQTQAQSPTHRQSALFSLDDQTLQGQMIPQSSQDLCAVANKTKQYLDKGPNYDATANQAGIVAQFGVDFKRVKQTLAFICQVQQQDKQAKRTSRLADIEFINQHFDFIRWLPDKKQVAQFSANKPLLQKIPDDKILLTKYYVKLAQGSPIKTPKTPYALYSLPIDEQDLTIEQADSKKDSLIRYRYTKQQVLTGILDQNQWATPLLWLSRQDLEDTLMQGTAKVDTDFGSRFFNVHRNNGIGYERGLKKEQQKRYWYFKETPSPLGYGKDAGYKIPVFPFAAVAGDIDFFGLGKLFMLSHDNQHRLAVLADTGGAFVDNQYQLDFLGGYFKNWQDYVKTYRHFPDYFDARILLLKDKDAHE